MLRSPGEFQCKSARVPSWAVLETRDPCPRSSGPGATEHAWASESWLVGVVLTQEQVPPLIGPRTAVSQSLLRGSGTETPWG